MLHIMMSPPAFPGFERCIYGLRTDRRTHTGIGNVSIQPYLVQDLRANWMRAIDQCLVADLESYASIGLHVNKLFFGFTENNGNDVLDIRP